MDTQEGMATMNITKGQNVIVRGEHGKDERATVRGIYGEGKFRQIDCEFADGTWATMPAFRVRPA